MFEVQCLDAYGNTINYFTQWDVDQTIYIPIDSQHMPESGLADNPAYYAPQIHFCNSKMEERYITRSSLVEGSDNIISATVPNVLLQDSYPVFVYVYMTDSQDVSSQKVILRNEIPVRKAAKPSDYLYVENIDRITAEMIKEEIETAVNETRQDAIDDINETREEDIATVNNTRDTAVANINSKRDSAIEDINQTTAAAILEVDNQMNASYDEGSITVGDNVYTGGFINIGNDIISDLDSIKEDSLKEYNDTVAKADETQVNIETSINDTMTANGLSIQPTDDGNGNVDIVILLNQSSE